MIENIFLKLLNKEWPSEEELLCLIKNYYGDHPHIEKSFEQPVRSRLTVVNDQIELTVPNNNLIEPVLTDQGILQHYYNTFTMSDLERITETISR